MFESYTICYQLFAVEYFCWRILAIFIYCERISKRLLYAMAVIFKQLLLNFMLEISSCKQHYSIQDFIFLCS